MVRYNGKDLKFKYLHSVCTTACDRATFTLPIINTAISELHFHRRNFGFGSYRLLLTTCKRAQEFDEPLTKRISNSTLLKENNVTMIFIYILVNFGVRVVEFCFCFGVFLKLKVL